MAKAKNVVAGSGGSDQCKITPSFLQEETAWYVNGFDAAVQRPSLPANAVSHKSTHPMWLQGYADYELRSGGNLRDAKTSPIDRSDSPEPVKNARRALVSQFRKAITSQESVKHQTVDASKRLSMLYEIGAEMQTACKEGELTRVPVVSQYLSSEREKSGGDGERELEVQSSFQLEDS